MLIPLGTERQSRRPTLVTPAIMAVTILSFVALWLLGAMSPERALEVERALWLGPLDTHRWWQPLTSTLLHGGLLHLAGNMLFLWVFGPSVEDRFGRLGFMALYAGSALVAGWLHVLFEDAPAIGASGAIAGITGSFLVLSPRSTVRCFTFLGFGVIGVPAWWFVGFAIAWDLFAQGMGVRTGIAHAAHLGGYAAGFGVSMLLLWLRVFQREPYDLFTIFRQAHRRRQFREAGEIRDRDAKRLQASEPKPRPDPKRAAIASARAEVSQSISRGDLDAAAHKYRALLDAHGADAPGTTLSRQPQYDLANHLFQTGSHRYAAAAYEAFIAAHPEDREAPTVRLMLALLYTRYLARPADARGLLDRLMGSLSGDELALAEQLRAELGSAETVAGNEDEVGSAEGAGSGGAQREQA